VTITVNNLNDAPVAAADSYSTDEETLLTVDAPGVLNNDNDVDADDVLTAMPLWLRLTATALTKTPR